MFLRRKAMIIEILVFVVLYLTIWQCWYAGISSSQLTDFYHRFKIVDTYNSLEQVQQSLRKSGLEACKLIIGVDFAASKEQKTYDGKSLHDLDDAQQNPYTQVISIIAETLAPFDEDNIIPAYGVGNLISKHRSVFPLSQNGHCFRIDGVLEAYMSVAQHMRMSGPKCFAPLIRQAIDIVKQSRDYHILVLIADGQVTNQGPTIEAIAEASDYPLSIIMVGVGEGPWDIMKEFDARLPRRNFDNFQFVDFYQLTTRSSSCKNHTAGFAFRALQKIPAQYKTLKSLSLIGRTKKL